MHFQLETGLMYVDGDERTIEKFIACVTMYFYCLEAIIYFSQIPSGGQMSGTQVDGIYRRKNVLAQFKTPGKEEL